MRAISTTAAEQEGSIASTHIPVVLGFRLGFVFFRCDQHHTPHGDSASEHFNETQTATHTLIPSVDLRFFDSSSFAAAAAGFSAPAAAAATGLVAASVFVSFSVDIISSVIISGAHKSIPLYTTCKLFKRSSHWKMRQVAGNTKMWQMHLYADLNR